jgi:hypothetical protein
VNVDFNVSGNGTESYEPYVKNEILPVVMWKAFLKFGNPIRSVEIDPEIK